MYVILNKDNNLYLGKNAQNGDIHVSEIEKAKKYNSKEEANKSIRLLNQISGYKNLTLKNENLMKTEDFKNIEDDIEQLFDNENSYEKYEKDEHLFKEYREEPEVINIKEVENPIDKYLESQYIEDSIYHDPDDLTTDEPVEITITNLDGSKKSIILGEVEKQETKEEITQKQLIELKEYINNNKLNIDSIDVKKGTKFHKKIPLKDFINKELNTTNYSSNPEKLGEDIILSLLKPLKVFNNYLAQNRLEKNQLNQKEGKIPNVYTVGVNGQEYQLKNYSEDFKKIIVLDSNGKEFEFDNNKNVNFIIGPEKKFNSIELDLINKGKSLIQSSDIPFKVSSEKGVIKYQTITSEEYDKNLKNIKVEAKEVKSIKHSI